VLRFEMLPAEHGDCLLVEYGEGATPRHRVLFDAGPETAYPAIRRRLLRLPATGTPRRRKIDLLVVTHVDGDHIEGVVKLLQDEEVGIAPADVWFNDWNHLAGLGERKVPERLGPEQGEFLGALLDEKGIAWNGAFGGDRVMVPPEEDEPLPRWCGPGGLVLTVLSPTLRTLVVLRRKWKKAIEAAGFRPGGRQDALAQFAERRWARAPSPPRLGDEGRRSTLDSSEANGSSIAVLAEFGGRSLLLSGDAFPDVLRASIERLARQRGLPSDEPFAVDVFKLAHHGSTRNMTPQLMDAVAASAYAVSSSGARFRHPDREALDLVVGGHRGAGEPTLLFNYASRFTEVWRDRPGVTARYGEDAVVELET
jgi:hypothetical protein